MTSHSLDACLRLVADRHRRRVIHHLRREANSTARFDDLVEQLHGSGPGSETDPPRDRERLAIQLRHTYLPKLAEYGVVAFDHRSGAVRYQPDEQVEMVLDLLTEEVSVPNPRGAGSARRYSGSRRGSPGRTRTTPSSWTVTP